MRTNTVLALVAVLLCSACAEQTSSKLTSDSQTLQLTSIRWDEAVSAERAALVNNSNLITMR